MKTKTILFAVTILALLIIGAGCDEKDKNIDYYSGEIISLNKGDGCFDIINIKQAPNDGLPIGTYIAFSTNMLEKDLKIGDIVQFRINNYEEWAGPATAACTWPTYSASIELVSN